jgi:hypothetical protein
MNQNETRPTAYALTSNTKFNLNPFSSLGDEMYVWTDKQADRHYLLILCSLYKEQNVTTDRHRRVGSTRASYSESPGSDLSLQGVRMLTGLSGLG